MALSWITADHGGVMLKVRVQPRSGRTEVAGLHAGALKIRLAAPPVDGAANRALVAFLAKELGLAKTAIEIRRGEKGRLKSLWLPGLSEQSVRTALRIEG